MRSRNKVYTVSQVNSLIKEILENNLPGRLTVAGEMTDFKQHDSGHCYFSLKDEGGKLPCVMWRSNFNRVKFDVENGLAVLATGFVDVYPPQGKYQFYVESLQPKGIGALQLKFEQTFKRLKAEGFFDDAYKKALPVYPERIGILTSESGAAIHDIVNSIHNRWGCAKLYLYPVPVQGEGAAEKIAAGLRELNRRNKQLRLDVLIVGRGGGSLEDLWAFNEEVVARAIFASKIPVISAVGHEIDTTIADLVADARASTPTKAGVIAVPDTQEVLADLANKQSRLVADIRAKLDLCGQSLQTVLASAVFKNPLLPVLNRQQQLDETEVRLQVCLKDLFSGLREELQLRYEQVRQIEPHRLLARKTIGLSELQNRARAGIQSVINNCRMQLTARENLLCGLNPRSVLQRGYSITRRKKTGLLVRNSADVEIGDLIATELAGENLIESKVTKK